MTAAAAQALEAVFDRHFSKTYKIPAEKHAPFKVKGPHRVKQTKNVTIKPPPTFVG